MLGYMAKIRSDYSIYLYAAVAKSYRIINVSHYLRFFLIDYQYTVQYFTE